MAESRAVHITRGQVTQAVIVEVGPVADLPATEVAAHKGMIDGVVAKERAVNDADMALTSKAAHNDIAWRELWSLASAVRTIGLAKAPTAGAAAALEAVDTSHGFAPSRARARAEQLAAALNEFPEDFTAAGMTKGQLLAAINARLTADQEEANLAAGLKATRAELKVADADLDRENKRIYKILLASFRRGSREREIVESIPTSRPAPPPKPQPQPQEPAK